MTTVPCDRRFRAEPIRVSETKKIAFDMFIQCGMDDKGKAVWFQMPIRAAVAGLLSATKTLEQLDALTAGVI